MDITSIITKKSITFLASMLEPKEGTNKLLRTILKRLDQDKISDLKAQFYALKLIDLESGESNTILHQSTVTFAKLADYFQAIRDEEISELIPLLSYGSLNRIKAFIETVNPATKTRLTKTIYSATEIMQYELYFKLANFGKLIIREMQGYKNINFEEEINGWSLCRTELFSRRGVMLSGLQSDEMHIPDFVEKLNIDYMLAEKLEGIYGIAILRGIIPHFYMETEVFGGKLVELQQRWVSDLSILSKISLSTTRLIVDDKTLKSFAHSWVSVNKTDFIWSITLAKRSLIQALEHFNQGNPHETLLESLAD